jgi:hypothetical protein
MRKSALHGVGFVHAGLRAAARNSIATPDFNAAAWMSKYLKRGPALPRKKSSRGPRKHCRSAALGEADVAQIEAEVERFEASRAATCCADCRRTREAAVKIDKMLAIARKAIRELLSTTHHDTKSAEMLHTIVTAGSAGIRLADIGDRHRSGMLAKDREPIIAALVKAGLIVERVERGPGRPARKFFAVSKKN